jgi:hypothetical protein
MSEIVKRVARALAKAEGYQYDPHPYDERARAAIKAMREPTEAMLGRLLDGGDRIFPMSTLGEFYGSGAALAENYRAMIDSILE